MEAFEFLGGRYNRPEQIMSGPVQAFKAQNAANGRTVFIHRVSTTEAPAEQSALLKLLTTALVKSAEAKRLVLDFGEESGYWYVVTESEPQCALLREWLQLQIDAAFAGSKPAGKASAPLATTPATTSSAPTQKADPGEFTRFLQRPSLNSPGTSAGTASRLGQKPAPPPPPVGEFSRIFQNPPAIPGENASASPSAPPPEPAQAPLRPPPGEFTNFFNASGAERNEKAPPTPGFQAPMQGQPQRPSGPPPDAIPQQKTEPGEFTRFFTPGLPVAAPKQSTPNTPGANFERSPNEPHIQRPYVQRPNSPAPPLPPPPAKPTEPGEFTRMFSRPDNVPGASSQPVQYPPPPDVRSDPMGFAKPPSNQLNDLSNNLFNDKIEVGRPLPSSQPQQSEFTKIFGAVGSEATPIAPPAVVAAQRDQPLLDEAQNTRQLPAMRPQPPTPPPSGGPGSGAPASGSPSEFTMIMQGGYGQQKPAGGTPAPSGQSSGAGGMPINVNVAPMGAAMPYLGSAGGSIAGMHGNISQHGASVSSALGSANMSGPHMPGANLHAPAANLKIPGPDKAAANKKLMLFFVLLGLLALILVIVVMVLMKSK